MQRIFKIFTILIVIHILCVELKAQSYQWVHPYQSCTSKGEAVAFDNQSGLYFCGQIRPTTFLFDSLAVPSYGYEDGIFCKVDSSSGQIIWLHTFGSTFAGEKIYDLKVTGSSIYLWGAGGAPPFYSMYIDGTAYVVPGTCFAKFDTSGSLSWVISRIVQDFTVGNSGNIYISSTIGQNYGIVKLNSSGTIIDSLIAYPASNSYFSQSNIICDSNEDIVWARPFKDSIDFQGTIYYANQSGTTDYLIVKCDSNLNIQTIKHVSGLSYDYVFDMIVTDTDNIALLTTQSDSSYYDNISIPGAGSRLMLLTTDNNLNLLSYQFINTQLPSVAMIRENDVGEYFVGLTFRTDFTNNFIFNGDTVTGILNSNIGILTKLDHFGNISWYKIITKSLNPNYTSGASSIKISQPYGNKLFITGSLLMTAIFDTVSYFSPGGAYTALLIDTTYNSSLGIENAIEQDNFMNIYPNPIYENCTVILSSLIEQGYCGIYDVMGNVHFNSIIQNSEVINLDLETLHSGLYFIHIIDSKKSYIKKIIKM